MIVLLQCFWAKAGKTEREIAICNSEMLYNYQTDVTCGTYKISQGAKNRAQNQVKMRFKKRSHSRQFYCSTKMFWEEFYTAKLLAGELTNQMGSVSKYTEEPHQCQ